MDLQSRFTLIIVNNAIVIRRLKHVETISNFSKIVDSPIIQKNSFKPI